MEKSKLRLLVVEDEKKLCDMIAKSLHLAGYEVDMCNDGEQALEMIYAELYDLIVLDLNLPGVDGMEILRELRKENEETKVLILSADSFSGSIRVHMSSLRKKLKAGLGYDPIVNKIGEGYKIGGNSKA